MELQRNALVCVPLCEEEDTILELNVLDDFTDALFRTHAIDEVEPLVSRYLEAAKAESDKQGRLILYAFSKPLHECATSRGPVHLHPVLGAPSHCSALAYHQGR